MRFLQTNSTRFASVLDEHYERLSKFKWKDNGRAVYRFIKTESKFDRYGRKGNEYISLTNEVMNTRGIVYDHINRDYLRNIPENLRPCNRSQNMANILKRKGTTSKCKGVSHRIVTNTWESRIRKNGKSTYLGSFKSEVEAALVYDRTAKEIFGEFAILNFPDGLSTESPVTQGTLINSKRNLERGEVESNMARVAV